MQIENVIIVSDFGYMNGGNAKVAIQTALAMKKRNKNVYFFCGVGPIDDELLYDSVKTFCLNQHDIYERKKRIKGIVQGVWNRKAEKDFFHCYKELDKDVTVVHFHSWSRVLSPSVIYMAAKIGFKIFFTMHDYNLICPNGSLYIFPKNEICYYRPLSCHCILCNCDRRKYVHKLYRVLRFLSQNYALEKIPKSYLVTISQQNNMLCEKYFSKNKKAKLIYNPTDINIPKRVKVENNMSFVFIGRISDEKGIRLFCEAITIGNYRGIVLGDGYLLEKLKKKYENIIFMGWCDKEKIIECIENVRAMIFPSLWYEGAPLVIMEMLQHGIPCIVSDVSSATEKIDDKINGYVFKSNDIESLLKVMRAVMEDNCLEIVSLNAQESFMHNRISIDKYSSELLTYYIS